jgi:hypothetical protein
MKIITGNVSRPASPQMRGKSSLPNALMERLLTGLAKRKLTARRAS